MIEAKKKGIGNFQIICQISTIKLSGLIPYKTFSVIINYFL